MRNGKALFKRNSVGTYVKPTEGISEVAYRSIRRMIEVGDRWVWISTSKSTDESAKGVDRRSYILGAVYVTGVMESVKYKRRYKSKRAMSEFRNSKDCDYQMIIPTNRYARVALKEAIEMHKYEKGENRQSGVWEPNPGVEIYKRLEEAKFQE